MDFEYEDSPQFYDQAIEATGNEEVLQEFREGDYESPFELLDPGETAKVVEVAETQKILNGDSGSLAGMDYLHTGSASD